MAHPVQFGADFRFGLSASGGFFGRGFFSIGLGLGFALAGDVLGRSRRGLRRGFGGGGLILRLRGGGLRFGVITAAEPGAAAGRKAQGQNKSQ